MALTTVEDAVPPSNSEPEAFEEPPNVVTTPCDPWPRPYYHESGFRRVAPYHYTFNTHCKGRWIGRKISEVFTTEFRDRSKEYYIRAIESGNATVNGKPVALDYLLKNGEVISHTLHRHEPPVTSLPIGVIHEDDRMLVIDKPSGIPVHPAGRYNYNSIIEIIRAERGYGFNPRPCNRLDRLTSGVMFIGKDTKAAEEISDLLRDRNLQKEYVARVRGKFPDGVVVCDQPIMKVSPQLGLNRARATGKEARTKFRRLAYYRPTKTQQTQSTGCTHSTDDDPATPPPELRVNIDGAAGAATPPTSDPDDEGYSIVHCVPLTGRTHQLRVHLQYLGHPITNDPIYSNRRVFGPNLGREESTGDNDEEIISRLAEMGKHEVAQPLTYETFQTPPPEQVTQGGDDTVINDLLAREHDAMVNRYLKRKGERLNGRLCETCGTELYSDPGVDELGIFLHAVSYAESNGKWQYRSSMPRWGMPPEGMQGPTSVPAWSEDGEDVVTGSGQVGDAALVEGLGAVSVDDVKGRGEGLSITEDSGEVAVATG